MKDVLARAADKFQTYRSAKGHRICRTCTCARARERYRAQKVAKAS